MEQEQKINELKRFSLDDLLSAGLREGRLVEITLFKGAEYDNGYSPAPTVDPEGYDLSEKMENNPGLKTAGYVRATRKSSLENRDEVYLQNVAPDHKLRADGVKAWYIKTSAIHSWRFL